MRDPASSKLDLCSTHIILQAIINCENAEIQCNKEIKSPEIPKEISYLLPRLNG